MVIENDPLPKTTVFLAVMVSSWISSLETSWVMRSMALVVLEVSDHDGCERLVERDFNDLTGALTAGRARS